MRSEGSYASFRLDHLGFYHYALDTVAGTSGSPIIQDGSVVGIHLGHDGVPNIGISSQTILNIMKTYREDGPCEAAYVLGKLVKPSCRERIAFLLKVVLRTLCEFLTMILTKK